MIDLKIIMDSFRDNIGFLNGLYSYVLKREKTNVPINNRDLKLAATRVSTPKPFEPYKHYVERSTGKKFDENLQYTLEEVQDEDEKIIKAFRSPNFDFSKLNLDYLLKSAIKSFYDLNLIVGNIKVLKCTITDSLESYPNNTSSGFPIFKRKDNEFARKDAYDWTRNFLRNPQISEILSQPTAVFHRFQYRTRGFGKNIQTVKKIRPVWGVSYRVLGLEGVLFRDLIRKYDLNNKGCPVPVTTVGRTKAQISTDIIKRIRSKHKTIISADYDKFDSTVPGFMWALFYAVFNQIVDEEFSNSMVLKSMLAFHCFTPYCWRSTKVKYQFKGVPSGCLITSMFNTWVNRTIINYAFQEYSKGTKFADDNAYCLGDDLLFLENGITFKHFLNVVSRFGMVVDANKCEISHYDKVFSFIGYNWDIYNRPTQTIEWYIAHLVLPSRFFRNYPFPVDILQTYRAISICMGLYQGMEIFERLIGNQDRVYVDLINKWKRGDFTSIVYVGEDMRYYNLMIPLDKIFSEGWEAF